MQVLLVFTKEDPFIITLKNAILNCEHTVKCCKNIEETHEAFKKTNYDLVFIDCRRSSSSSNNNTKSNQSSSSQYDYENICRFIKKLFHYTTIVALTPNYEDKDVPSILPFLKIGFSKTFSETTSLNRCVNEILTLEYNDVSNVKLLQAAHTLFTALEYTSDPIEIMNDQFKLLYVNSAFEKLTGYALGEINGKDFSSLHNLDESSSNELLNRTTTQSAAWECELPFSKVNGEMSYHSSLTIPVIVQGETNKVQNYVTITNLTDNRKLSSTSIRMRRSTLLKGNDESPLLVNTNIPEEIESSTSSTPTAITAASIRKITSFNIPKKSYDFERFAAQSVFNDLDDNLIERQQQQQQQVQNSKESLVFRKSSNTSNTLNTTPSHQQSMNLDNIEDDDKISPTTTPNSKKELLTNTLNITRSSPEFHHVASIYSAASLSGNNATSTNNNSVQLNNYIQRKRSYDVQSPYTSNYEGGIPRRHSMARVHQQTVEAPIRKVINIICLAHESSTTDIVKQNLDKALEILRSTELYNPSLIDNDKHTNDLVSGLMSNGLQKKIGKKGTVNIIGNKSIFTVPQTYTNQTYIKNLSPEINKLLEQEESWNFDVISLERVTNKRPLVTLGLKTMNRFEVCEYLKIDETVLVNWLTLIESNYKTTNPYHNSTHASDVLHATAYFLSTDKLTEVLDTGDRVASLIAAAVHDLNHPGRTNAFLCNSNNDLAILYNDQAVLENHHAALAFQLTRRNDDSNIFKNLSRDDYRALRSIIIDMVLATEMNKHFEHLNKFVNKFGISDEDKVPNTEVLKTAENKLLIKRILIKCADVSNPCRPLDIYKEWTNRIASEYFEQTDDEKQKGLPVVMPTFDRTSCNIPKAQISFIEYFINDMFEAWDEFIYIPEIISNLQANTVYWRECAEALQNNTQKSQEESQPQQQQQQHNQLQQQISDVSNATNSIFEDTENETEIQK